MTVESRLGRVGVEVNDAAASGVRAGSRLVSAGLRDDLCRAARDMPYRPATEEVNRLSGRTTSGDELPLSFVLSAVATEGAAVSCAREAEARRVLAETGAFDGDGVPVEGLLGPGSLPEALRCKRAETVVVEADGGADPAVASLTPEPALSMGRDELLSVVGLSAPYSGGAKHPTRRRSSREEVAADDKAATAEAHVAWLAGMAGIPTPRRIIRRWVVERDSSQCCYVSVDAVLVDEQCAEHVRGGKPEARDSNTYVKHWNARVEADGRRHNVSSTDEGAMWLELMACLAQNGLLGRRVVFLVDGETRITERAEMHLAPWDHQVLLDWYHLEEKLGQFMSLMVVGRRVDDPDAEVEYYKRGKNKGKPKPCRHKVALSRLYAKEACLIAWVGNVAQLIAYVRCIPDEDVKDESARASLLGYLERKADMITCYSLRKKLGLRNSSNGSEQLNQLVVSQRQKQGLMAWREPGSGALAQVSTLYLNEGDRDWFAGRTVTFDMALCDAA